VKLFLLYIHAVGCLFSKLSLVSVAVVIVVPRADAKSFAEEHASVQFLQTSLCRSVIAKAADSVAFVSHQLNSLPLSKRSQELDQMSFRKAGMQAGNDDGRGVKVAVTVVDVHHNAVRSRRPIHGKQDTPESIYLLPEVILRVLIELIGERHGDQSSDSGLVGFYEASDFDSLAS
jgi:hypothetical protein